MDAPRQQTMWEYEAWCTSCAAVTIHEAGQCTQCEVTRMGSRGRQAATLGGSGAPSLRARTREQGQFQPEVVRGDRTPAQEVVAGSQGELPYRPEVTARCGDRDSSAAMKSAMEIHLTSHPSRAAARPPAEALGNAAPTRVSSR